MKERRELPLSPVPQTECAVWRGAFWLEKENKLHVSARPPARKRCCTWPHTITCDMNIWISIPQTISRHYNFIFMGVHKWRHPTVQSLGYYQDTAFGKTQRPLANLQSLGFYSQMENFSRHQMQLCSTKSIIDFYVCQCQPLVGFTDTDKNF